MSTFHDFLTWFDGWSENIEETPSARQWERLRQKIDEVREAAAPPAMEPPRVQSTVHLISTANDPGGAGTGRQPSRPKVVKQADPRTAWITRYKATLMDLGYDAESAHEMMPRGGIGAIDPASDPVAAARAAHAGMAN